MGASWGPDVDALAHGLAGAVGGVFAIGVFFPLEVLRTRLQIGDPSVLASSPKSRGPRPSRTWSMLLRIAQKEGIAALYQGFNAVLVTVGVTNFVYFCAYKVQKQMVAESWLAGSTLLRLVMAGLAGVVTVLVTTPLWLVNTRMKVQSSTASASRHPRPEEPEDGGRGACDDEHPGARPRGGEAKPYTSLLNGLIRVWQEEGAATLWDGTAPSLVLVSNPAIQWATYELMKERLVAFHGGAELWSAETFLLAAVAKAVATVATYPLQVAQTALRYNHGTQSGRHGTQDGAGSPAEKGEAHAHRKRYRGTADCLLRLYRGGGTAGLFRGLEAKMLQTVLTAAFHVLCYEEIVRVFLTVLTASRGS